MGNSIFDDDDDGFSLSGGIEGEETKKSPPAPVKPVTKVAPPRPDVNRNTASGLPATGRRVAPAPPRPTVEAVRQPAPATPRSTSLPTQRLTSKPAPATPVPPVSTGVRKPLPVMPSTSLPVIPPAVYAKPEETYTEDIIPATPVRVEPQDITYANEAEESLHENYRTPVDYEAERLAEEKAEERAAERRRERAREQERADRISREREERERERNRLEAEVPSPVVPETVTKPLSRKEQAIAKREEDKAKREARKNKGRTPGEKTVGKYSGGRNKVLILRVIIFSFIAILAFSGLKASFFPPKGPTANQVIETAKFGLGVTDFPTERGTAFVLGFSKIYLTIPKDESVERIKQLSVYAPSNVISQQGFSKTGGEANINAQIITSGPYISGIVSKDDENAVYTVSAELNNTTWVYIDVPVQYTLTEKASLTKGTDKSFVISGVPSFVPAPEQAKLTPVKKEWANDDQEAGKAFAPDAKLFFEAWAKSTSEVIAVHTTPDADISSKSGLNGIVKLKGAPQVSVQPVDEAENPTVRKARVVVVWENMITPGVTYSQPYDLIIVKADNEDHWKIKSLKGGVPIDTAS